MKHQDPKIAARRDEIEKDWHSASIGQKLKTIIDEPLHVMTNKIADRLHSAESVINPFVPAPKSCEESQESKHHSRN